eukprot:11160844-Lingulodinium_polyedra.AAC.1
MLDALGIDEARAAEHLAVVGAGRWTQFPRERVLLSTIPVDAEPWQPSRRPAPWDSGWNPHRDAQLRPMMRSRQQ